MEAGGRSDECGPGVDEGCEAGGCEVGGCEAGGCEAGGCGPGKLRSSPMHVPVVWLPRHVLIGIFCRPWSHRMSGIYGRYL